MRGEKTQESLKSKKQQASAMKEEESIVADSTVWPRNSPLHETGNKHTQMVELQAHLGLYASAAHEIKAIKLHCGSGRIQRSVWSLALNGDKKSPACGISKPAGNLPVQ